MTKSKKWKDKKGKRGKGSQQRRLENLQQKRENWDLAQLPTGLIPDMDPIPASDDSKSRLAVFCFEHSLALPTPALAPPTHPLRKSTGDESYVTASPSPANFSEHRPLPDTVQNVKRNACEMSSGGTEEHVMKQAQPNPAPLTKEMIKPQPIEGTSQ